MARVVGLLWALLLLAAPAIAETPYEMAVRVADWQLAHIGKPVPSQRPETYDPRGWVMGAFYVGLTDLADRYWHVRFTNAILDAGIAQQWQLGPRPFHADDHIIAETWIWAYELTRDKAILTPVRARFDAIIAAAPHGSLDFTEPAPGKEAACQDRWCWSDALFMGPPTWFALSRATGDPQYSAYADKEYWATVATTYSCDQPQF